MGDTDSVDVEHSSLLDADTIPNANQSMNCFSCGENMNGVYCYACGNKNDNYRRSIWSLGVELFSSLTAFEGRIWRSLRSLIFKPGQMAREFSDGARQKWTSPIRLYLATSLLLFGYVALSGTQLVAFGTKFQASSVVQFGSEGQNLAPQVFFLERRSTIKKMVSEDAIAAFEKDMANLITDDDEKSKEDLQKELDRTRESLGKIEKQIDNAGNSYAKAGISRAKVRMLERIKNLENQIENYGAEASKNTTMPEADSNDIKNENDTQAETKDETNIDFTDITGNSFSLDSEGITNAVSVALREPERINSHIGKRLSQIMFAMMPFSMLLGAIFIRGREKAMLFDHLVHAAYIHAFSFLLLFVFMLFVQFTPIKGLLWIYMAILLIYLPISAKRMFGRSWFKSILISYGVGAIYTFIMMLILAYLIGLGVSDILRDVAIAKPT